MSKLGISLCVVLLALATNAVLQPDNREIAQHNVETVINEMRSELERKSEYAFEDSMIKGVMLSETVETNNKIVEEDIRSILSMVGNGTWMSMAEEKGVNITTCNKFESHLENLANNITSQMKTCISNRRDSDLKDLKYMIKTLFDIASANLTKIEEEVQHCGDNDHGQESNALAISCINAAEIKIPSITVTLNWELNSLDNRFREYLSILGPNSTGCNYPAKLENFRQEKSATEGRVNKCIQEMISATEIDQPQSLE